MGLKIGSWFGGQGKGSPNELENAFELTRNGTVEVERGNYGAARRSFEQAMIIFRRMEGDKSPGIVLCQSSLGFVLMLERKWTPARQQLEDALTIQRRLGEASEFTTTNLWRLIRVTRELGDHAAARAYCSEYIAILGRTVGSEHSTFAAALNELGLILAHQSEFDLAHRYCEEALAIRRRLFKANGPEIAESLQVLWRLALTRKDHTAARRHLSELAEILRKILGNEICDLGAVPHELGLVLNELGSLLIDQNEFELARQHIEEALTIWRFQGNAAKIVTSLAILGDLAFRVKDYASAQRHWTEAVATLRQVDNPGFDLAIALSGLGGALTAQDELDLARPHFEEALSLRRRLLKQDSSEVAESLIDLGMLASKAKDYASARIHLEEAIAILRRVPGDEHPGFVKSLRELGWILTAQHEYDLARQHFEQALAIRRRLSGQDSSAIAQSLNDLGTLAAWTNDHTSARTHFVEAVALFRQTPNDEALAESLESLGVVLAARNEIDLARQHWEESLAIRRRLFKPDSSQIADSLTRFGMFVASKAKDNASARMHFEEAIAILRRRSENDHPLLAESLRELGMTLTAQKELGLARQHFDEALAIRRRVFKQDSPEVDQSLYDLGRISEAVRDFAAAKECYSELVAVRQQTLGSKHPALAHALYAAGVASYRQGRLVEGHRNKQDALNIFRSAHGNDHIDVANTLHSLGITLWKLRRFAEAKQCIFEALAIKRRIASGDEESVADTLYYLGCLLNRHEDIADANVALNEALILQQRILGDHHVKVSRTKAALATNLIALGGHQTALQYISEIAQVQARQGDSDSGDQQSADPIEDIQMLNLLGMAHRGTRGLAEAARCHENALAIARRVNDEWHIAESLHELGVVLTAMGDRFAAQECLVEACTLLRRIVGDNAYSLGVGWVAAGRATTNGQDALQCFSEALRIAMVSGSFELFSAASCGISEVQSGRGALATAIFFGKLAVNSMQRLRGSLVDLDAGLQDSFLSSRSRVYHQLAAALVDAGRLGEAQQGMFLLKHRELLEFLRQPFEEAAGAGLASFTPHEVEWKGQLDAMAKELAALAAEETRTRESSGYQAALNELEAAIQRFRTWFDQLIDTFESDEHEQVVEVEGLNRKVLAGLQSDLEALGPDVALLQYVLSAERLSIIVTTPTAQVSHEIAVTEHAINRLVFNLRAAIDHQADLKEVLPPAQELYRHLIAPAASTLEQSGASTLMVSLDGVIRYLPLAALHDGRQWLIERYALAMLTPAAPRRLDEPSSSDWRIAGFGVSRGRGRHGDLEGAADELNGIVRVDGAGRGIYPGVIYLNEAFTEDALAGASRDHQVIHIASHFVFKPANELASYLVTGDGRITLERFKQRPFDFTGVDLIALSACETAMGGGRESGREVEGFGALVQKQGARAVIATLWPATDWTTEFLMRRFYQERRERKRAKAAALRIAQLALLHDNYGIKTPPGETRGVFEGPDDARYSHPYYWAPFILMGNWL